MSDGIKRKSPTEILNEKYKDCMPSEFEGKVWDNKLIEAMYEFANQQQKPCHHKPLSDAEMLRMANAITYHPIAHEGYLKGLMKANELIFKLTHK